MVKNSNTFTGAFANETAEGGCFLKRCGIETGKGVN
jgi:hypothetical protein